MASAKVQPLALLGLLQVIRPGNCPRHASLIVSLSVGWDKDESQLKHWGANNLMLGVSSKNPKGFCYHFRIWHQDPTASLEFVKGAHKHEAAQPCRGKLTNPYLEGLQSSVAHSDRWSKFLLLFLVSFLKEGNEIYGLFSKGFHYVMRTYLLCVRQGTKALKVQSWTWQSASSQVVYSPWKRRRNDKWVKQVLAIQKVWRCKKGSINSDQGWQRD